MLNQPIKFLVKPARPDFDPVRRGGVYFKTATPMSFNTVSPMAGMGRIMAYDRVTGQGGLGLLSMNERTPGLGDGSGYGYNFLGDVASPVGGATSDDLPLSRGEFFAAQRRQLITAAVGGLAFVALGGIVTYFVTRR